MCPMHLSAQLTALTDGSLRTHSGGPTGQRASNYPLNGAKGSLWQGGVRGMGFVAGGDLASFGFRNFPRVSHSLIHVSDWNPTLCEL